jgi:hypothetical protein
MFDNYTLKARFYPVIILFLPIVITGIFYSFEFKSLNQLLTSAAIVGALTYLFSQLGRDQGKKKEPALWKTWGGSPSVQILRLRDQHLNKHTKQRYHQKLQSLFPVDEIPNIDMETNDSIGADEVYKAWSQYLISQTRDGKKFSLLLKDNISYGFRRNLWGLKLHGIILTSSLIIGNYLFEVIKNKSWNPFDFTNVFQYSSFVLVAILLFWLFVVTKQWIKIVAFSYAERLLESVENI